MFLRGLYSFSFGLYFFHLITMCVEQQLAIIVTGRGKMDDQDDHPLSSGSATETHPRTALFRSHSHLRLHEAYGKCKQTMEQGGSCLVLLIVMDCRWKLVRRLRGRLVEGCLCDTFHEHMQDP